LSNDFHGAFSAEGAREKKLFGFRDFRGVRRLANRLNI
jgi:hypothetical protein